MRNIISIVTPNVPFPRGQYTRNSFVRIVLQLICLTPERLQCDSLHDLSMYIWFVLYKSENSNSIWWIFHSIFALRNLYHKNICLSNRLAPIRGVYISWTQIWHHYDMWSRTLILSMEFNRTFLCNDVNRPAKLHSYRWITNIVLLVSRWDLAIVNLTELLLIRKGYMFYVV